MPQKQSRDPEDEGEQCFFEPRLAERFRGGSSRNGRLGRDRFFCRNGVCVHIGFSSLFVEMRLDAVVQLVKLRGPQVPRIREGHVVDVRDVGRRAGRHDADAAAEQQRFLDVVGDKNDGFVGFLPNPLKLLLHGAARHRVERAERLIHEQDGRIVRQHAGQLNALLHAAGQLARELALVSLKTDQRNVLVGNLAALGRRDTLHAQAELYVLPDREPGEQGRIGLLEDDGAVLAGPVDLAVSDAHLAGRLGDEARDETEQRRFAAAARPQQDEKLAAPDRQIHVLNDVVQLAGGRLHVAFVQAFDVDFVAFRRCLSTHTSSPCSVLLRFVLAVFRCVTAVGALLHK